MWPLNSMLFLPAHKLDWVRKVDRYQPDAVILDLEDAVPPALKNDAREMAREGVAILKNFGIAPFVRINGWGEGGEADVARAVVPGIAGIVLPKTNDAGQIRELDLAIAHAEGANGIALGTVDIVPIPETTRGIYEAREIAAASKRCQSLMGMCGPVSGDVARAMGFLPTLEGFEQMYLASKTILDSRAGGAPYPMGSIIGTRLDDLDSVRMLCVRAKQFGFSGAVLIHPSHVAVANEVFAPTQDEVDYAVGLLAAMREAEKTGSAAVSYRGAMVDYAMEPRARDVIAQGRRRGLKVD